MEINDDILWLPVGPVSPKPTVETSTSTPAAPSGSFFLLVFFFSSFEAALAASEPTPDVAVLKRLSVMSLSFCLWGPESSQLNFAREPTSFRFGHSSGLLACPWTRATTKSLFQELKQDKASKETDCARLDGLPEPWTCKCGLGDEDACETGDLLTKSITATPSRLERS